MLKYMLGRRKISLFRSFRMLPIRIFKICVEVATVFMIVFLHKQTEDEQGNQGERVEVYKYFHTGGSFEVYWSNLDRRQINKSAVL